MENLLIWGSLIAATGLLFFFLVAAERELKKKSRRLEELESELRNASKTKPTADQEEKQEERSPQMEHLVNELREENIQLQEEINELKKESGSTQEKEPLFESAPESLTEGGDLGEGKNQEAKILGQPVIELTPEAKVEEKPTDEKVAEHHISQPQDQIGPSPATLAMAAAPGPEHAARNDRTWMGKVAYKISFAVILVFALAWIVAAGLWRGDPKEKRTVTANQHRINLQTDVPTKGESETPSPAKPMNQAISTASESPATSPVTSGVQSSSEKKIQVAKNTVRGVWGEYEVLQPTPVYSEPREESQTVASISPGAKVNVVDVKGDWLEVRSKHGRPPGFIKKGSAVPTGNR
ncbi:MAG: hypothetical protein ACREQA_15060 [Candidatus Binatia bacterium]